MNPQDLLTGKKQPKLTKTEQQVLKDLRESPEGRMVYEAGTFRTGGRHSKVKHRGGRTAVAIDKLVTKGLVTATQRTYNEDGNIWTEYRVTLKGDA